MTFNKIPDQSRNRSYSDRIKFDSSEQEKALLTIADYLGGLKRKDWASAYRGAGWYGTPLTVKQRVTALSSLVGDVYAKAIISDNDAQYNLARRTLKANRAEWHRDVRAVSKSRSAEKRALRARSLLDTRIEPSVCFGGRQLWREAQKDPAKMEEFKLRRMWLGAVGRSDYVPKSGGPTMRFRSNQMIRLTDDGEILVSVPIGLRVHFGVTRRNPFVTIGRVHFNHGQSVINKARAEGRSITFHIQRLNGHWILRAQTALPTVEKAAKKRIMGVDVNAGHLDAWVLDEFGNPVGSPITLSVKKRGMANAVNSLLAIAAQRRVTAVAVENLRGLQRRTTRGGKRGSLNRAISTIQSGEFRRRIEAACEDRGWSFEAVNPSGTSKNADSWSDVAHRAHDSHQKASFLIGRRSLGLTIIRDETGRNKNHSGGSSLSPEAFDQMMRSWEIPTSSKRPDRSDELLL